MQYWYCCIMSSRQLHSHGESDGLSLSEKTRKGKKSSEQPEMDQQTSPQPNGPASAQPPTGNSATPATSPAARTESTTPQATGLTQTPATHVGLLSRQAHHKYFCKIHKLQVPTFLQYLVLSLQKTGSAPAASRRCVTKKLQLASVETHKQDHQHILYHQGLDPLQQWTTPPKEIKTNEHFYLLWG